MAKVLHIILSDVWSKFDIWCIEIASSYKGSYVTTLQATIIQGNLLKIFKSMVSLN